MGQMKRQFGSNETFHLTLRGTVSFDQIVYGESFSIQHVNCMFLCLKTTRILKYDHKC